MTPRPKSKIPNERMRLPHKYVASVLVLVAILALFSAVMNQTEALGLKISHFWESCPLLGIIYDSIFKMNLLQKLTNESHQLGFLSSLKCLGEKEA